MASLGVEQPAPTGKQGIQLSHDIYAVLLAANIRPAAIYSSKFVTHFFSMQIYKKERLNLYDFKTSAEASKYKFVQNLDIVDQGG